MREEIFKEINAERIYQETKYGEEFDSKNTANDWVTYITRYASNAAVWDIDPDIFKEQMIKVAAIAVASIEAIEKNGNQLAKRHYDI